MVSVRIIEIFFKKRLVINTTKPVFSLDIRSFFWGRQDKSYGFEDTQKRIML